MKTIEKIALAVTGVEVIVILSGSYLMRKALIKRIKQIEKEGKIL